MYRLLSNICSNWVGLLVSIIIAFWVSPIIVNSMGKEMYGVWTLIVSITGYFTVLDFGVNTAIVRYISSSIAKKEYEAARSIFSTSILIFALVSFGIVLISTIIGYFLPDIFSIKNVSRQYLYVVFMVSALDLALGLLFSVYQGSLIALQEFVFVNAVSIVINIIRSIIIVIAIKNGAGIMILAVSQLLASLLKAGLQYVVINNKYNYLRYDRNHVNTSTIKKIYNYSVYSFLIAISLKLLFYTDSVVIAARIGVAEVAFYSIPATLLDYLEKLVWSMISVLVPIVSANHAYGNDNDNRQLYIYGTRYTLLISLPIIISLYFYGDDFIGLWMGPEFGRQSYLVLKLLLIGFGLSFSQLIAHGLLKGVSRHKVLAYILCIEALLNFTISMLLAKKFGIEGVAVGTMVPLLIASVVIIFYTCNVTQINILNYVYKSYSGSFIGCIIAVVTVYILGTTAKSYIEILLKSSIVSFVFLVIAAPFSIESSHVKNVINLDKIKKYFAWSS